MIDQQPDNSGLVPEVPMSAPASDESMPLTRRDWLAVGAAACVGAVLGMPEAARGAEIMHDPFRYCLNTSTIRGQKLSLVEEIELAGRVGFTGIEPWIREMEAYQASGGSLLDLKKRIVDAGLTVESAIGFPTWCVDDEAQRKQGIETFKRDADLVRQLGGQRIAAPPFGARDADAPLIPLATLAERYGRLLDEGREIGVTPMVEIWGHSRNLSRLGEAVYVAVESGRDNALILPDIYHIYRGGSDLAGLRLLSGAAIEVFHVNDYPTDRPRTELTDADRVHVGDGQAPCDAIFRTLAANGCRAALSLELFNPGYWEQDAEQVLGEGLQKVRNAVSRALGVERSPQ